MQEQTQTIAQRDELALSWLGAIFINF